MHGQFASSGRNSSPFALIWINDAADRAWSTRSIVYVIATITRPGLVGCFTNS